MDATNKKTLAGVLVALMVGSVFAGLVAVAPTVAAQSTNPTGAPDVTVNVTNTRTEFYDVDPTDNTVESETLIATIDSTSPNGGPLRSRTAYDLTLTNIGTVTTGYGYIGTDRTVVLVNSSSGATIDGGSATAYDIRTGFVAATFAGVSFPGPGIYLARQQTSTGTVIARLFVHPSNDLTVNVAPNSFAWATGSATYTVTVSNSTGGIEGATLGGFNIPADLTTLAGGTRTIVGPLPGAGDGLVHASVHRANTMSFGQPSNLAKQLPAVRNNITATVTSLALNNTMLTSTAFVGFTNTITFRPSYADTAENVFETDIRSTSICGGPSTCYRPTVANTDVGYLNISYTTPNNILVVANGTYGSAGFGTTGVQTPAVKCMNLAAQGQSLGDSCSFGDPAVDYRPATLSWDTTTGIVSFRPGRDVPDDWAAGTYRFNIQSNIRGAHASAPEYTLTFDVNPAAPAAVNVEFTSTAPSGATTVGNTVRDPSAGTLDVLQAAGATGTTPTIQSYTLAVTVSGTSAAEHPGCRVALTATTCQSPAGDGKYSWETTGSASTASAGDASPASCTWTLDAQATNCFVDNITLRGDLLPGWRVASFASATGVASITGVTPTRNGTIYIDVQWKNATTTLAVPVIRGANVTADLTNLTVDVTETLTATVRAATGGFEPSAYVRVFQRDADGGPFLGATGSISEKTGTNEQGRGLNGVYTFSLRPTAVQDLVVYAAIGSSTSQNFSYYRLDVLPNQNLNVTLNVNATMAALRTSYVLNASNATQGFTGSGINHKIFFLNEVDRRELLNNGTSALFSRSLSSGLTGVVYAPASVEIGSTHGLASTAFGATWNASLAHGSYWLYFCSGFSTGGTCTTATYDNRNVMLPFNVSQYTVTATPAEIASSTDIQQNTIVSFRVTDRNGQPVNGSLAIVSGAEGTNLVAGGPSVTTVNGVGNMTLSGKGTVGKVRFTFDPTDAGTEVSMSGPVLGNLSVVAGNLTFTPSKVPILQSTLVTIRLANFTGAGLPGRVIRLCGNSLNPNFPSSFPASLATPTNTEQYCTNVGTTGADGSTGIVVNPTSLSAIGVYINGSYTERQLPVSAGALTVALTPTAPTAGGDVTIKVTQPGGTASTGARVLVTRDGATVLDSSADANGESKLTNLSSGNYTVAASRTGFDNGTASFSIGAVAPPPAAVLKVTNLTVPETITRGTEITVSADITNTGTATGTTKAFLLIDGVQRASQDVSVPAGGKQTVGFDYTFTSPGDFNVVVSLATGDESPAESVTVSQPTTPTTPTRATPTPTTPTTVTPSPTPSPTTATPSPTPTPASPTPTATATPTEPTTAATPPRVPGFEVVALIAALGVALVVFGRRN